MTLVNLTRKLRSKDSHCDGTRTGLQLINELSAFYPDELDAVVRDVKETLEILREHQAIFATSYEYEFCICAIFYNESAIIKQWIEHHLLFGCQHFYLIDNNSTDNTVDVLEEYISKGLVTLVDEPRPYRQHFAYDEYFLSKIRDETRWIAIIDIDEYLYPRNGEGDIRQVLENNNNVDALAVPWLHFGSSGHIAQPENIVDSFIWRCDYNKKGWTSFKTLGRTASLAYADPDKIGTPEGRVLGIHSQRLKPGSNFIPSFSRHHRFVL